MHDSLVQETGGNQAPPLAANQNIVAVFGAEVGQSSAIEIESHLAGDPRAVEHGGQIESHVDEQDHHGREARMGDQATQNVRRGAAVDGARADLRFAVRAHLIVGGDKGPAIRAHAALVHGQPHDRTPGIMPPTMLA